MRPEADGAGSHKAEILSWFCVFSSLCRAENFLIGRRATAPSASIVTGIAGWQPAPFPLPKLEFETRDGRE
jgi:hypothetical protein